MLLYDDMPRAGGNCVLQLSSGGHRGRRGLKQSPPKSFTRFASLQETHDIEDILSMSTDCYHL